MKPENTETPRPADTIALLQRLSFGVLTWDDIRSIAENEIARIDRPYEETPEDLEGWALWAEHNRAWFERHL
jgi:hypothetical protein